MGRAEMQMLRTGDLAGGGGETRALNLFPPHTHPRECSGATCGLEKVEPAPSREPLQGSGRWGQWPAGAPALLWAPPRSRRGKGGASGSADGLRTGLPQLWSVDLGKSKATGPSPSGDALFAVPPCMGSGVTWYPRDSHTLRPLPRQP